MKLISMDKTDQVDANNECFIIKNVFAASECSEVTKWLSDFLTTAKENEKIKGENWHYHVLKDDTDFNSFLFNDLKTLGNEKLIHFYRVLFQLFQKLGERTDLNDFEMEISPGVEAGKTINPLVFWYPAGVGKFTWHQHPGTYQRFQLLCNLTKQNLDYTGGETLIDMDGTIEKFAADFDQGDVFSFPYTKRHMVNEVRSGSGGLNGRISLLMPLIPRKGIKGVSY